MRAAFDALRVSDHAVVLNLGSAFGVSGAPRIAVQPMAEEAIGALAKSTAIEWGGAGVHAGRSER